MERFIKQFLTSDKKKLCKACQFTHSLTELTSVFATVPPGLPLEEKSAAHTPLVQVEHSTNALFKAD